MGSDRSTSGGVRTYPFAAFSRTVLVDAKGGRTVTVCIPAYNEATTVADVVRAVRLAHVVAVGGSGLVDEVLVVNDGSADATAGVARSVGARVLTLSERLGKGGAMQAGLDEAEGDLIIFLDADVENTTGEFVTGLLGPLLLHDDVALVKGYYERPLDGIPGGGGRVNELMARPVLEVLFPDLAAIRQPLAGETAAPRWVLEKLEFAAGYGIEIGLLIDVATRFGVASIAQVDLGTRTHRNRALDELRPQAVEILRTALARIDRGATDNT